MAARRCWRRWGRRWNQGVLAPHNSSSALCAVAGTQPASSMHNITAFRMVKLDTSQARVEDTSSRARAHQAIRVRNTFDVLHRGNRAEPIQHAQNSPPLWVRLRAFLPCSQPYHHASLARRAHGAKSCSSRVRVRRIQSRPPQRNWHINWCVAWHWEAVSPTHRGIPGDRGGSAKGAMAPRVSDTASASATAIPCKAPSEKVTLLAIKPHPLRGHHGAGTGPKKTRHSRWAGLPGSST